ncbi:hypothetical protein [Massilia yuzhufengensis]|uniref:Uncharacterized protein n=1 Tax=Massilia yuzhufengensis TaxID=1164594 RepID=A0A1I1FM45_9BURK|nr:hypothetical protein [Massilia yuzhufengensis]SFC00404.1 hypothetical protein SAMN05216204_10348 [Massilia yuzhufengensis]
MSAKKVNHTSNAAAQEVCIDLPGESVQCWRSSDKVKVILRKHRDVIFDINLKKGALYTVVSKSQFYSPREKKLLRQVEFSDGEKFHIWVGREFKGSLVLSVSGTVLGQYNVVELDPTNYGTDPKEKPEPLLVTLATREQASASSTTAGPLNVVQNQLDIFALLNPKLPLLANMSSTRFDYSYPSDPPDVREYVAVADVHPAEIRADVLRQLETGPVSGKPSELLSGAAQTKGNSHLYKALGAVASTISGNDFVTSTVFKESAGYLQEHIRSMDKILMMVRIEKKAKGQYRAIFKGKPVSKVVAAALAGKTAKTVHQNVVLGSKASSFIDGGFAKSGKAGYGARRIMLTATENFKGGVKIQIIGTVIDLFVDVHTVYFDEKGSKDLSELLGRAGVSIAKAGLTAVMGSVFAASGIAMVTAGATIAGLTAAPVIAVVAVVVGGYILAGIIVDKLDDGFKIKHSIAEASR